MHSLRFYCMLTTIMIIIAVQQNQDFAKRCLGYSRGLPLSYVDFRTCVLRRCEMEDLDRPTVTSLDALHLLLKRHCQQEILRCMLQPLTKLYEEGVVLSFIGDVPKRYVFNDF